MKTLQKSAILLLITLVTITSYAAIKDKRIRLKNGKGRASTTLNPSRTYKFVINGKQFKKLSINLRTKGGKIHVEIKSPKGKILASGYGRRFTIKNVGSGVLSN